MVKMEASFVRYVVVSYLRKILWISIIAAGRLGLRTRRTNNALSYQSPDQSKQFFGRVSLISEDIHASLKGCLA